MGNFKLPATLVLFLAWVSHSTLQNVIPPELEEQIDTFVVQMMEKQHIPGLALSLVRSTGDLHFTKGYGLRDLENNLPADNNTLFAIGSASKSFAGVIIAKKLNELFPALGESVLDVPIRELAPTYDFTLVDRYRSERVTFRDLLAHRVDIMAEMSGMLAQAYDTVDEMFFRYRYAPESEPFRTTFHYNNGLIAMASHILAHMANTTYENLLGEFLTDAGMMDTTWIKPTDDHNNMMFRAVPYIWKDENHTRYNPELLKSVSFILASGAILTSANDFTKYMLLHLNKGKVGDRQVVPEEVMGWLTKVSSSTYDAITKTPEDPDALVEVSVGYRICLYLGVYNGWVRVGHTGYIPPYITMFYLYPDLGLGMFASLTGPGPGGFELEGFTSAIFNMVTGSPVKTGNLPKIDYHSMFNGFPTFDIRRNANTRSLEWAETNAVNISLEQAVGTYGSGFNGEINLSIRTNENGNPQLYWKYGKMGEAWLIQVSPSTFLLSKWGSDLWMVYWATGAGFGTLQLTFLDLNTIRQKELGQQLTTEFIRGEKLDDLPLIPWQPDSC
ncbi:uncharacterized protein LOC110856287 [Folsomia candida]|uniref:Gigasin-6 n=1 Tax=Folsomia candida TaxID=158441 RepID=A0A226DR23_FOLCA|nr:uncharacterized protein LOC110856287 [Folsomia candida]OXA46656.1 Gigasin-6 [Folsomia candida]